MEKAKNIKEIARLAGVSTATVSRVINQNGRFSKETEKRVRQIIQQNDYTPNMSAQGLRTSRTDVVGVVVPDITNPHFSNVVLHLEVELSQRGYACLICNTNESEELEKKHIRSLTARNVSGIILISSTRNYAELEGLPTVYVDRPSRSKMDRTEGVMIESDNVNGGYLAAKALLQAGCRRILILKCLGNDSNQAARYTGFKQALEEAGIEEQGPLIDLDAVSIASAEKALSALIEEGAVFDGVMATTDTIAGGAMIALREHGLHVPKDVLMTGFDDSPFAALCGPGITSVHQNVAEMSRLAISLLFEMMAGKEPACRYYRIPVTLTVRNSTRR